MTRFEVADMSQWRAAAGPQDIQRDTHQDDELGYYGGWTIGGIAVLATIGAVWVLGM